jgi:hypothetical protein
MPMSNVARVVRVVVVLLLAARGSSAAAPELNVNVPIPGGVAALARALGIESAPDRAMFCPGTGPPSLQQLARLQGGPGIDVSPIRPPLQTRWPRR